MATDDTSKEITTNSFFGLNKAGTNTFGTPATTFSMLDTYGYDSDINLESFVYASKLESKLVIPAATLTGTYYKGKMRLAQFFDSTNNDTAQSLSVMNLIRAADEVDGMRTGFTLQSSMVNDYILTHTLRNGSDVLSSYLQDNDLGSEVVDYVVLQSPAINISAGTDQTYSMI